MALEAQIGGEGKLFVGEDKIFILEVVDADELPVNIASWEILFDVRKQDTSGEAIFSETAAVTGAFNANRTLNSQRASVQLTDTQLNTVSKGTYRYSWKRMTDGNETVLAYGDFVVEKATAP